MRKLLSLAGDRPFASGEDVVVSVADDRDSPFSLLRAGLFMATLLSMFPFFSEKVSSVLLLLALFLLLALSGRIRTVLTGMALLGACCVCDPGNLFVFKIGCGLIGLWTLWGDGRPGCLRPMEDWCVFGVFSLYLSWTTFSFYKLNGSLGCLMDSNYLGVLFFVYFMFSVKRRHVFGIFFCLAYLAFISDSRSMKGLVLLFLILHAVSPVKKLADLVLRLIRRRTFVCLCIGAGSVLALSFFWIDHFSVREVDAYREGFNDTSNFMRFSANTWACEEIQTERLYLHGYGSAILEEMGIDDEDYDSHPGYNGVRLVQPHNSVINLLMRCGAVWGVLYLFLLCLVLDRYNRPNCYEYIYPYLFNAMFMHSLFDWRWVFLWFFVLSLREYRGRWRV